MLLLALLCWPGAAHALDPSKRIDQYAIAAWSISDGLPHLSTDPIAQDDQGYLWIGSTGSLSRFDGHRFINYSPENTPDLPGGWVSSLLADKSGRLWIGTSKGVAIRKDGTFQPAPFHAENNQPQSAQRMAFDRKGRLLIAGRNGVFRYDDKNGLKLLASVPLVWGMLDTDDGLWLSTDHAIYRLRDSDLQQIHPPVPFVRAARFVEVNGQLWMGLAEGLFRFDGQSWHPHPDHRLNSLVLNKILVDRAGSMWLLGSEKLIRLRNMGYVDEYLIDTDTSSNDLFEDRAGNLWLSTTTAGLTRFSDGIADNYPLQGGFRVPVIWTATPDDKGQVITGGIQGLSRLEAGRLEVFFNSPELPQVVSLLQTPEQLWIGSTDGVLSYHQGKLARSGAFEPLRNTTIRRFFKDRSEVLWILSDKGLFRLAPTGQLVHAVVPGAETAAPIRSMLQRRDGSLLAAGEDGLFKVVGDKLLQVDFPRRNPTIVAMHELAGGQLLASTFASSGLQVLDGKRWVHIGSDRGMPGYMANSIVDDGHGSVWVSGQQGVYRLSIDSLLSAMKDPQASVHPELLITTDARRHGGQQVVCCAGGSFANSFFHQGRYWTPYLRGLLSIPIQQRTSKAMPPNTFIDGIRIGEQWQMPGKGTLKLPGGKRNIGFSFNALTQDLLQPANIRYRLLGYDNAWHMQDDLNARTASYTNLPPGDYRFEVSSELNNSSASSAAALAFEVPPYFHETASFRILLALALLAIVLLFMHLRTRLHRRRQRALQTLIEQRTRELSSANRQLESLSKTDPLTGLFNRRYVEEQIIATQAATRASTNADDPPKVTLFALLDIDRFKLINDMHGHDIGDLVLKEVSRRLSKQIRPGDYVARWGGEEFLIVVNNALRDQHAPIAKRLRDSISATPFEVGQMQLQVTASIGLSELPSFKEAPQLWDWEQSLWLADKALYSVKHNGRDDWAIHLRQEGTPAPSPGTTPQEAVVRKLIILLSSHDAARQLGPGINAQ